MGSLSLTNREAAIAFISVLYKVDWARHHLDLLNDELEKFKQSEPYTIGTYDDIENEEYWMFLETKSEHKEIGLIAGDFVACLRASLDHLATALTMIETGTSNPRASFPVIGVNNSAARQSFTNAVIGIPESAVRVINSFQPYHSGTDYITTKLWKLHRLCNIDKHRRIPVDSLSSNFKIHCPPDVPFRFFIGEGKYGIRFSRGNADKVYVDCEPESIIMLGDESDGINVPHTELREIYDYVRKEIMPAFKDFFVKEDL
jgi:hypothetical protein